MLCGQLVGVAPPLLLRLPFLALAALATGRRAAALRALVGARAARRVHGGHGLQLSTCGRYLDELNLTLGSNVNDRDPSAVETAVVQWTGDGGGDMSRPWKIEVSSFELVLA